LRLCYLSSSCPVGLTTDCVLYGRAHIPGVEFLFYLFFPQYVTALRTFTFPPPSTSPAYAGTFLSCPLVNLVFPIRLLPIRQNALKQLNFLGFVCTRLDLTPTLLFSPFAFVGCCVSPLQSTLFVNPRSPMKPFSHLSPPVVGVLAFSQVETYYFVYIFLPPPCLATSFIMTKREINPQAYCLNFSTLQDSMYFIPAFNTSTTFFSFCYSLSLPRLSFSPSVHYTISFVPPSPPQPHFHPFLKVLDRAVSWSSQVITLKDS